MTSSRPYIARALYEWILDNDCTPYILVDAARRGVEVPREFVKDGQIVLNISPSAVRALQMENEMITFSGRFGGEALTITIPIDALMAIYARENGQGMVFEVEPQMEEAEEPEAGIGLVEVSSEPKPAEQKLAEVEKPDDSGDKPKKPGRPNLKVVK
ncbi:ClpXP protease specificity-enhancing factor [Endozoicomonas gorgoniicola]|uniref:ClpXP protease specificity-enhancing factor n=1 Tax=Endozoicomonas gorgoniicola TaxID=1234144 RepID=A0ABT3MW36_9GAMM|nr:ClpXP protease specificity-enhancing factor [Endozoicomonas gorgoniicola]